jgi:hypothetical protein
VGKVSVAGYDPDRGLITKRWDHIERPDRQADLAAAHAYLPAAKAGRAAHPERYPADFDWVIDVLEEALAEVKRLRVSNDQWERMVANRQREVERLRGLLARLEHADHKVRGVGGTDSLVIRACCPACQRSDDVPHDPGCWIAAELGR